MFQSLKEWKGGRTHRFFLAVCTGDRSKGFDAHLVEVSMEDAGHEEGRASDEFEEAAVVVAVES